MEIILQTLLLAFLLGGMIFFPTVVAPAVFTSLDKAQAGSFLRKLFPNYYSFIIIVSGLAAILDDFKNPVFFICIVLTIFYLFHGLFFENNTPGFTTQTLLILFTIAFNSIFLGIVGEYVGRIYRQIKKNDIFIIKDKTKN